MAATAADGALVSADQSVLSFVVGTDGPLVGLASKAGKVDGLKLRPGDKIEKGMMLFRIVVPSSKKLVPAILPPALLPRARVGSAVEFKVKSDGTRPGQVVRIEGAIIVVDPAAVDSRQVESLRLL